MRALLVEHDAILHRAIDKHHGHCSSTPVTVLRRRSGRPPMVWLRRYTHKPGWLECCRHGWGCIPAKLNCAAAIISGGRGMFSGAGLSKGLPARAVPRSSVSMWPVVRRCASRVVRACALVDRYACELTDDVGLRGCED